MKKLTKIKLINWHIYNDIEIEISGNTVISGENGAGKSTLIDAILYVISAGTCKFNTAANEKNDRNLESYVRGKLGFEKKEFLRPNDTISHVVLEFFDDLSDTYSVIGSIISANVGSKIEKVFYHIPNSTIKSEFYYSINGNKKYPTNYEELKRNYNKNLEFDVLDGNIEAIKKKILICLNIEDSKYLELLPKALAFKPIGEIDKFVYDYLLPRKDLDLVNMKESVRRYRHLQDIINLEQDKLNYLNPIKENGLVYDNLYDEIKSLEIILNEKEIDKIKLDIDENKSKIFEYQNQILTIEQQINEIDDSIERAKISKEKLQNSDIFEAIKKLENDKKNKIYRKETIEKEFQKKGNYLDEIYIDLNILNHHSAIKESFYKSDFINYQNEVNELKKFEKTTTTEVHLDNSKFISNRDKVNEKINYINDEIKKLNQGFILQDDKVELLKRYLNLYFFDKYNKNIKISAFYELVEVKDEKWRNALEGFLNKRKTYLFIEDGKYFDEALKVYEDYANSDSNLYGVGLVNVDALEDIKINENSLASKLDYLTEDARKYGAYVLNNIFCVDKIEKLKEHDGAITSSCMLYQGKVASKINPKFYSRYYLGINSIKLNIQNLEKQLSVYKLDLSDYENKISLSNRKLEALERIRDNLPFVNLDSNLFLELEDLNKSIDKIEKEIISYNNSDIISLREQIKEIEDRIKSLVKNKSNLDISKDEINKNKIALEIRIDNSQKRISEYNMSISDYSQKNIYKTLKEIYYLKSSDAINDAISKKSIDLENKRRIIISNMSKYCSNPDFHCDLNPEVSNLDKFISLCNQIECRELVKFKDDARIAKEECEKAFKNDYIMKIRDNINEERQNIKRLNDSLSKKPFGSDKEIYKFVVDGTKKPEYEQYYQIFISNESYTQNNLFETEMSERNLALMDQLFERLNDPNEANNEKELAKFTDYRNFLSYDIQITDKNGNKTFYSKAGKGKSGGETQTPFYVFIAASFEQIVSKTRNSKSPACLVFLDEAFNNMDDSRIQTMMDFYRDLQIQLIISVPTLRINSILKYCDTGLSIIKKNNQAFIYKISKKEIYDDRK